MLPDGPGYYLLIFLANKWKVCLLLIHVMFFVLLMAISLHSPLCPTPLLLILLWNAVIPSPALFPTHCSSLGIKQEIGSVQASAEIQDELYPPGSHCASLSTCIHSNGKKKILFTDICSSCEKMKLLQVILHHLSIKSKRLKRLALETPCRILHVLSVCCCRCRCYRYVGIKETKKKQMIVLRTVSAARACTSSSFCIFTFLMAAILWS